MNLKSVKAAAHRAAVEYLIKENPADYQGAYAAFMASQGYTGTTASVTTWVPTDTKETDK